MNAKSLSSICHFRAARLPEGCGLVICSTPVDIKNVEPVLLPVPLHKALALPD